MSSSSDPKLTELLKELVRWARFEGIQKARQVLLDNLKKDSEKLAYHHSDGRGSPEVARLAGVSDFAIRSYWKKWQSLGLVTPSMKHKGRFESLFSLEDLGIEVPLKGQQAGSEETPMMVEAKNDD